MKYLVSCGDLRYEAQTKAEVLKIIKTMVLPFIQIKADIKISKHTDSEELTADKLLARRALVPRTSFLDMIASKSNKKKGRRKKK